MGAVDRREEDRVTRGGAVGSDPDSGYTRPERAASYGEVA
jgi:hypothetical protein